MFNMLGKKLSWITLLLLCRHGVDAERTLTCEGGSAYLSCECGYMKVNEANYGRTDQTMCASGRPANQISNTHCFQETSVQTMSARCDGRKSCSVPAVNSVFSDPCLGTYKYLDVSYDCIPSRRSITCEFTQSVIVCVPTHETPEGVLWYQASRQGWKVEVLRIKLFGPAHPADAHFSCIQTIDYEN